MGALKHYMFRRCQTLFTVLRLTLVFLSDIIFDIAEMRMEMEEELEADSSNT